MKVCLVRLSVRLQSTLGLVLALISLAMLIFFIDYISHGIQVSNIIATVAHETIKQINLLYSRPWREDTPTDTAPEIPAAEWGPVLATQSGYVQYIDYTA